MSVAFERAAERAEAESQRQRRDRSARGQRAGFRIHATVFAAVNLMLVVVWALTGAGYPWFLYALLGWGVGLAAHFAAIRDSYRADVRR
jgi:fatty acid desaturase